MIVRSTLAFALGLALAACGGGGGETCGGSDGCFSDGSVGEMAQPLLMSCAQMEATFRKNCGSTDFQGCGDYILNSSGFHAICTCDGYTSTSGPCEPYFVRRLAPALDAG